MEENLQINFSIFRKLRPKKSNCSSKRKGDADHLDKNFYEVLNQVEGLFILLENDVLSQRLYKNSYYSLEFKTIQNEPRKSLEK